MVPQTAAKIWSKDSFFKSAPLNPSRHQRTLFIQLIYSCFSRYQVPTNSVAPSSVYKAYTTHNSSICSDEGLTLETSAFQSLYGGRLTLSTPLINQIFLLFTRLIVIQISCSLFTIAVSFKVVIADHLQHIFANNCRFTLYFSASYCYCCVCSNSKYLTHAHLA